MVDRRRSSRPRSPPSAPSPTALAERRLRSLEEPLGVRLRARATYPILEVRNPLHKTRYLVLLPMFPGEEAALCTCTDFARRGLGSCKHISAGHRWLLAHPDALPDGGPPLPPRDVGEAWDEIDRRLRDRSRGDRLDIRGVEAPGLALFGRAGDS